MSAATPVATLLVDVRPVDHPTARDRGIGRYTAGLLGGLVRTGAPVVGLYATDAEAERAQRLVPDLALRPWGVDVVRRHAGPGTWYLATQLMLHPIPLDPIPAAVTAFGLPVAAVMYDVIPYRHPDMYLSDPNARALAELRAPLARTVDAMLAISRFSADTAAQELQYPAERMRVIGAGVEAPFVLPSVRRPPWPDRIMPPGTGHYVVAVTGGDERKNTEGLLRAWAELDGEARRALRLVVATAAPTPIVLQWRRLASEIGVDGDVEFTGQVTDDEMVALLQDARLAVLPSIEEGFGLPVLEAAACGCPAICSGTSSLPEVLDEPAAWFDPLDPASIARAIELGTRDENHRARLAAAARRAVDRFTWERVAGETMSALADLGPRRPRPAGAPSRRLAVVGPSHAGDPVDETARALRRTAGSPRVDRFVDGSAVPEPTAPAGGSDPDRFPARALGRYCKPWDYDDIVAVVGPSAAHRAAAAVAAATSCHVWVGDAGWFDAPGSGVARSLIVPDDEVAALARATRPDGPPILVLRPADALADLFDDSPRDASGDTPAGGSPRWSIEDVAVELLAWFADLDQLEPGTIRRRPAAPDLHRPPSIPPAGVT